MTSIAARILFASTVLAFGVPLSGNAARADVVTEWNVIALNATTIPPNSVLQSRTIAIVHAAIYDAANAVERKGGAYAVDLKAAPGTSLDAAVAAAAHGALVRLVPAQRPALDTALNATLAKIPEGSGKADGVTIGAQVAERMVVLRSSDGSDSKVAFTPTTGPGRYQLTSGPAILTQWGNVKPFVLRSMEGLEFKGAPELTSAEFARDFDEVKRSLARATARRGPPIRPRLQSSGSSKPAYLGMRRRARHRRQRVCLFRRMHGCLHCSRSQPRTRKSSP